MQAKKVYIACLYSMMSTAKVVRSQFRAAGFDVTSKWIDGDEETKTRAAAAQMDLDDVARADALVLLSSAKGTPYVGGGRWVEFGYVLGKEKPVFVVGDYENVFCWLSNVKVRKTVDEVIKDLSC